MHLSKISLALRQWGAGGFSPLSLFASGEQGVWYDPSDLSTMFQDSAGTTPVTADGQPVGLILDKSKGLALGPELIVNGDFASGAGWDLSDSSIVAQQCVFNAAPNGAYAYQYSSNTPMVFRGRFDASNYTQGGFRLFAGGSGVSRSSNGSFSEVLSGNMSVAGININSSPCSVTVDNVSLRQILGNHASQATAAARPLYKTDGTYHWLQFDGVDDGLSTAATTFGAGNFNSVYGMKRATVGNDVVAFSGSGVYFALTATGNSSLAFGTVGSTIRHFVNSVEIGTINATTRDEMHLATPATQKKVLTIKDFLASSFNPLQFGNYGGSYTFEGSLFSYIMADGMTPAEIAQTEAWVNSKTGAY